MTKAQLLYNLLMYVNAKRRFTAQDVAYEFGVSVRTAHRYLADLGEMGVPLYTEPGRGGGYRVLDNRTLPPVLFDEEEAFAIFFAFQALTYYHSHPFDIHVGSVSRKLYAGLPEETKRKVDRLDSVLAFWSQKRTVPSPFLKEILEAASEQQLILMKYESKSVNTVREVAPLGIYATNGFWYMPAYDRAYGEIRLFRTDRMVSVERTQQPFPPQMPLPDWLERHTRQTPEAPVRLYVELTREGLRQCRSQPWLEPYIVAVTPEQGYVEMEIDRKEWEFVTQYFFRLGTSVKVMEPREMADHIRKQAHELVLHYAASDGTPPR
ncbi:YafY family protein [Paenibacillus aurantius]|uniref:YafY family protein n=1 Tax=Paenibacillus aurantius TaxID=2918900 RepID=A0AA96LIN0_9BACL|nr:YafY family protein [Paenibacillus aurantius]WNQ12815.1 YafY family protein [Paenibacillus aurantius]